MKPPSRTLLASLLCSVLLAAGCSAKRPDLPSASTPRAPSPVPSSERGAESPSGGSGPQSGGGASAGAGSAAGGSAGLGGERSSRGGSPPPGAGAPESAGPGSEASTASRDGSGVGPTRAERIEVLDERYYGVLSGGGSGGVPGDGPDADGSRSGPAGEGTETAGDGGPPASRPAPGVRGGEKTGRAGQPPSAAAPRVSGGEDSEESPATGDRSRRLDVSGGGGAPEDIPPADNDDEFARQLRRAAEAETDPERRRKLWNEYRRYRGLPERAETQQSVEDETPPGDDP